MNFLELVITGKEKPEAFSRYFIQWEIDHEGKTAAEFFGVTEKELHSVRNGEHSFRFVAFRYLKRKHLLKRVFPGAYVQFAVEYDLGQPHLEYGWVDRFDFQNNQVAIQCDDSYFGNRLIEIEIEDILRLLPTKERPNIFFKAMLCQDCKDCPHDSGEFVPECAFYNLFSDIKCNRQESRKVIGKHLGYENTSRPSCRTQGGTCPSNAKQNDISAEPEGCKAAGSDCCVDGDSQNRCPKHSS